MKISPGKGDRLEVFCKYLGAGTQIIKELELEFPTGWFFREDDLIRGRRHRYIGSRYITPTRIRYIRTYIHQT